MQKENGPYILVNVNGDLVVVMSKDSVKIAVHLLLLIFLGGQIGF